MICCAGRLGIPVVVIVILHGLSGLESPLLGLRLMRAVRGYHFDGRMRIVGILAELAVDALLWLRLWQIFAISPALRRLSPPSTAPDTHAAGRSTKRDIADFFNQIALVARRFAERVRDDRESVWLTAFGEARGQTGERFSLFFECSLDAFHSFAITAEHCSVVADVALRIKSRRIPASPGAEGTRIVKSEGKEKGRPVAQSGPIRFATPACSEPTRGKL